MSAYEHVICVVHSGQRSVTGGSGIQPGSDQARHFAHLPLPLHLPEGVFLVNLHTAEF